MDMSFRRVELIIVAAFAAVVVVHASSVSETSVVAQSVAVVDASLLVQHWQVFAVEPVMRLHQMELIEPVVAHAVRSSSAAETSCEHWDCSCEESLKAGQA